MKKDYRGFEITVKREMCMAGYDLIYYDIFRKSDLWELTSSYRDGGYVREVMKECEEMVDDYYKNPQEYEEEQE